jgi:hypothetical protein
MPESTERMISDALQTWMKWSRDHVLTCSYIRDLGCSSWQTKCYYGQTRIWTVHQNTPSHCSVVVSYRLFREGHSVQLEPWNCDGIVPTVQRGTLGAVGTLELFHVENSCNMNGETNAGPFCVIDCDLTWPTHIWSKQSDFWLTCLHLLNIIKMPRTGVLGTQKPIYM